MKKIIKKLKENKAAYQKEFVKNRYSKKKHGNLNNMFEKKIKNK
jgi:hypothetical protein